MWDQRTRGKIAWAETAGGPPLWNTRCCPPLQWARVRRHHLLQLGRGKAWGGERRQLERLPVGSEQSSRLGIPRSPVEGRGYPGSDASLGCSSSGSTTKTGQWCLKHTGSCQPPASRAAPCCRAHARHRGLLEATQLLASPIKRIGWQLVTTNAGKGHK